jgi:hypothetical protein
MAAIAIGSMPAPYQPDSGNPIEDFPHIQESGHTPWSDADVSQSATSCPGNGVLHLDVAMSGGDEPEFPVSVDPSVVLILFLSRFFVAAM